MSQAFGTEGQARKGLSDKEIAQDILTSHKYLSNYYYAPAILESMDPNIRGIFQDIHKDTQEEAKMVFDYLHSRGWYNPRQANPQAMNDLSTAAQESERIISSLISHENEAQTQGGTEMIGREFEGTSNSGWQGWTQPQGAGWQQGAAQPTFSNWQGTSQFGNAPQSGWQTQGTGQSWQTQAAGQGFGQRQWSGTQTGEGQSGMGPSSLYQGARWGGQPSWAQGGQGSQGGQASWQGIQSGEGQSGMGPSSLYQGARWGGQPSWAQGGQGSQGGQASWQGIQSGEGQSGMGPSSLYQGARWGGQPSWAQSASGWQTGGPMNRNWQPQAYSWGSGQGLGQTWQGGFGQGMGSWQSQNLGQTWQNPQAYGARQWQGTEQGEGQSGMGPSSLHQGARWGGQPSWTSSTWGGQGGF